MASRYEVLRPYIDGVERPTEKATTSKGYKHHSGKRDGVVVRENFHLLGHSKHCLYREDC